MLCTKELVVFLWAQSFMEIPSKWCLPDAKGEEFIDRLIWAKFISMLDLPPLDHTFGNAHCSGKVEVKGGKCLLVQILFQ